MVYERDYIHISSTYQVCQRNPYLNTNFQEKKDKDELQKGLLYNKNTIL